MKSNLIYLNIFLSIIERYDSVIGHFIKDKFDKGKFGVILRF